MAGCLDKSNCGQKGSEQQMEAACREGQESPRLNVNLILGHGSHYLDVTLLPLKSFIMSA